MFSAIFHNLWTGEGYFREGSEFTGWGPEVLGGPSFIFTYSHSFIHILYSHKYQKDGLSGGLILFEPPR